MTTIKGLQVALFDENYINKVNKLMVKVVKELHSYIYVDKKYEKVAANMQRLRRVMSEYNFEPIMVNHVVSSNYIDALLNAVDIILERRDLSKACLDFFVDISKGSSNEMKYNIFRSMLHGGGICFTMRAIKIWGDKSRGAQGAVIRHSGVQLIHAMILHLISREDFFKMGTPRNMSVKQVVKNKDNLDITQELILQGVMSIFPEMLSTCTPATQEEVDDMAVTIIQSLNMMLMVRPELVAYVVDAGDRAGFKAAIKYLKVDRVKSDSAILIVSALAMGVDVMGDLCDGTGWLDFRKVLKASQGKLKVPLFWSTWARDVVQKIQYEVRHAAKASRESRRVRSRDQETITEYLVKILGSIRNALNDMAIRNDSFIPVATMHDPPPKQINLRSSKAPEAGEEYKKLLKLQEKRYEKLASDDQPFYRYLDQVRSTYDSYASTISMDILGYESDASAESFGTDIRLNSPYTAQKPWSADQSMSKSSLRLGSTEPMNMNDGALAASMGSSSVAGSSGLQEEGIEPQSQIHSYNGLHMESLSHSNNVRVMSPDQVLGIHHLASPSREEALPQIDLAQGLPREAKAVQRRSSVNNEIETFIKTDEGTFALPKTQQAIYTSPYGRPQDDNLIKTLQEHKVKVPHYIPHSYGGNEIIDKYYIPRSSMSEGSRLGSRVGSRVGSRRASNVASGLQTPQRVSAKATESGRASASGSARHSRNVSPPHSAQVSRRSSCALGAAAAAAGVPGSHRGSTVGSLVGSSIETIQEGKPGVMHMSNMPRFPRRPSDLMGGIGGIGGIESNSGNTSQGQSRQISREPTQSTSNTNSRRASQANSRRESERDLGTDAVVISRFTRYNAEKILKEEEKRKQREMEEEMAEEMMSRGLIPVADSKETHSGMQEIGKTILTALESASNDSASM